MKNDNILVQELLKLGVSYRAGAVELNTVSFRSEAYIKHLQSELPAEDFASAIKCAYLIEEINAVVLDQNRPLTQEEQDAINEELRLIEKIIARNCEEGENE